MAGTAEDVGGKDTPRQTPLIEEHRRLGARFAQFAGWEMPLWYTGASEEHQAVREAAGLFDIGHMGVIELNGRDAERFLDYVGTADASAIDARRCRYAFLLDPDGLPLDDVILYRLANDRFLAVVNAANADRVREWLTQESTRYEVALSDLTAVSAGADRLTGMALQGPVSAEVLAGLVDAPRGPAELARFELTEGTVLGARAIISRTGYTGASIGYELFVPSDRAVEIWRAILEAGGARGVRPAGLAARDSLRIEAGLPLYGHELAGPHEITPLGAGYARFVDFEKGEFVGREALLKREQEREFEIVRFRLDAGARAIRAEDPAGSRRGQMVGWVTSCAAVGEAQIGMAWIDRRLAREGTELLLYPARHLERSADLSDAGALTPGDRLPLHESATVIPRFPR